MISKDWGKGQFLDFMGGHSCYEGGQRAHVGPPLSKTLYVCMYVCMYVCGQIAQVVEHQTADPWVAGSSLTSGEKCKNC